MIENGFYYDFARDQPFTPEDFPKIEAKMRELIARDAPFTKEVWKRDDVRALFESKAESNTRSSSSTRSRPAKT